MSDHEHSNDDDDGDHKGWSPLAKACQMNMLLGQVLQEIVDLAGGLHPESCSAEPGEGEWKCGDIHKRLDLIDDAVTQEMMKVLVVAKLHLDAFKHDSTRGSGALTEVPKGEDITVLGIGKISKNQNPLKKLMGDILGAKDKQDKPAEPSVEERLDDVDPAEAIRQAEELMTRLGMMPPKQ